MNLIKLSFSYLRRRALNTLLNILLFSFGIATITILLLFSYQLEDNLYKNAEGIDVVVGAKGSPIQLILSSIYHIDNPTGNIKLSEAKQLMNHPMVASATPLALGDNYLGYRIVGSTTEYLDKYSATLREGTLWDHEFELVLGADVARNEELQVGDTIVSGHGFSEGGSSHDDNGLIVVGILEQTGTIADRLILTGVETMWGIHMESEEEEDHDHTDGRSITNESYLATEFDQEQITSLLIRYQNPLAAAQFPRFVNDQTSMQAAAPAVEVTRLLTLLGVGLSSIRFFALVLILASVLGIFIALLNSMKERKYDLAIMRTLGGSRLKLFNHVILEGAMISLAGGLLGIVLGHIAMEGIGVLFAEAQQFAVTGYVFHSEEVVILLIALGIGILSSLVPALLAYKTDIAETLSKT